MANEIWKDVIGYEGLYMVSSLGRIKSLPRKNVAKERMVKGSLDSRGYPHVQLYKEGKFICYKKHRLVAKAFLGTDGEKQTVNHKNGIKTDNSIENLEWSTHKENINHAIDNGFRQRHPPRRIKINQLQAKEIKENLDKPLRYFAEKFGVSITAIHNHRNR